MLSICYVVLHYVPFTPAVAHGSCTYSKSLHLWPTLCYPMDGSPLGFYVHGILQVKILGWAVAISYSGDLPDPGIEPPSLISPAPASGFFTTSTTWEAIYALLLLKETRISYSPSCFPPVTIIRPSTSMLFSKMHVHVFVELLNNSNKFQQNAEFLHHF